MKPSDRIFVALDLTDEEEARTLARRLTGHVGGFKLGLEFFQPMARTLYARLSIPASRYFSI